MSPHHASPPNLRRIRIRGEGRTPFPQLRLTSLVVVVGGAVAMLLLYGTDEHVVRGASGSGGGAGGAETSGGHGISDAHYELLCSTNLRTRVQILLDTLPETAAAEVKLN